MKKQIKNEKEILKLIADGAMPINKIAQKAGVSYRTIYNYLYEIPKYIKAYQKRLKKRS